jgi:hypothetical protein
LPLNDSRKTPMRAIRGKGKPPDRGYSLKECTMLVHIFRGPGRVFGMTQDAAGANLPPQFAPWSAFKSVTLSRDQATPGVDANDCLDDIERHGFHVTDAHVRITDQVV